jgi:peptide/nickel transport system substrate-binding protein
VLLAAAFVLCVSVCGRIPEEPPESALTILYDADERVFGPWWSSDPWFLMFLPLVTHDEAGRVAPRLAESWEHSPDYRDWTFHLRSDVRWHDGTPTTAHDVKFTIELQGRPDILYDDAWHDVDSIIVHDDTTLSIHYSRPKDGLNDWMVYWPKHVLEELDPEGFWEWDFWVHPIGNGPYRYVRHVPKTMVELEANPDFYSGKPAIDRVRLKFGGPETAVTELTSGNADLITGVKHSGLLALASDGRYRVYHTHWPTVAWIHVFAWNHLHPALADSRVRRALTMGLDRRELLEFLGIPAYFLIADVLYTPDQYLEGDIPEPIPFDPDGGRALLERAGWSDSNGDGIRERGGQPLQVKMLVSTAEDESVGVFAQAALRRLGVDLEVVRLDESVLRGRISAGDFDAAVYRLWNSTPGQVMWFARGLHTQYDSREFPDIGYRNEEVTKLLGAAMETVVPEVRDSIYRELGRIFLEDVPITLLYPEAQAVVAHRRLKGLEGPYLANPMQFLERYWIER